MATFLRFTATANEDVRRGTSLFKTPSMKKAQVLEGLCAFTFDVDDMTEEEILRKIKTYAKNFSYYASCGVAALIEGDYLHANRNGEGVVIKADYVIAEYELN